MELRVFIAGPRIVKELDRNIILNLIDSIEITDKENIKINYKFKV